MNKDAYYFPHFCNARHDRKIKRVTKQLGVEGYGIYFMLLEILREQTDYRYPVSDIDLLADEFGTSEAKVVAVVKNYELFTIDTEEMFFSENLINNMQPYLKMKEQRSIAGKASAEKRKQLLPFNDRSTTVQQSKVKESKVKESVYKEEISTHTQIIGVNYRPQYENTPDEFQNLFTKEFYNSWLNLNKFLDEECKYLRNWEEQITIAEYKKMFERMKMKEFNFVQAKNALTDLDGNRLAMTKYNSVFHGFNTYIKTILKNV